MEVPPRAALDARRRAFRALHTSGCFVIPNPWDVGSARFLHQLGFPALATTSAGFAFSQGPPDSDTAVSRDQSLATSPTSSPPSTFRSVRTSRRVGIEPQDVAESVTRCVATGVAGLSVEDATGDPASPLYELPGNRARSRRARRDRSNRRGRAVDGPCGVLPRRSSRSVPRRCGVCRPTPPPERTCSLRRGCRRPRRSRRCGSGSAEAAEPAGRP